MSRIPQTMLRRRALRDVTGGTLPAAVVLKAGLNGLGVTRSLGRLGIPVVAVDHNPRALGLASTFACAQIAPNPASSESAFVKWLLAFGRRFTHKPVLLPTGDAYLDVVSRNSASIGSVFLLPISVRSSIQHILDKEHQYQMAAAAGIAVPRTYRPDTAKELRSLASTLPYPVVLKPAVPHRFIARFPWKALVATSAETLERLYLNLTEGGHKLLVQEIIPGPDENLAEVCFYRDHEGRFLGLFTARKLEQQPRGFGTGTLFESCDLPELRQLGRHTAEALQAYGLGFAEFKMNVRTGTWCLIELNARTTHCNELSTHCGVNFSLLAYKDMLGQRAEPHDRATVGTFWVDRLVRGLAARHFRLNLPTKGARVVDATLARDDPAPALRYALSLIRSQARRVLAGPSATHLGPEL